MSEGDEFDYVTRSSFNNGILQSTGKVQEQNLNPSKCWSLGLLQMDFFYRERPWYAGQFIRKIIPQFSLTKESIPFFTALLNNQKGKLLSVLVRHIDETFLNSKVSMPFSKEGKIDFDFINSFMKQLEIERLEVLKSYLTASGAPDFCLTKEETLAITSLKTKEFKNFKVTDIFNIKNTSNLLSRDIKENSGSTPYLCASAENNGVSSFISYDDPSFLNRGNCVFIGGKTFVVSYQEKDFFSNDSHNLALYLKEKKYSHKDILLGLATCINLSLRHRYSWGNSISSQKIKHDFVTLPLNNGQPDFETLGHLTSALKKLVLKSVNDFVTEKTSKLITQ